MPANNNNNKSTLEDTLTSSPPDIPEEVTSWLGRLVLLYGVPFNYLIPEEQMLPEESLRFFFLDPIWMQCLVQGACSVGSNGYGDWVIDKAMNELVQPNQPDEKNQAGLANKQAAGERDRLRKQYEDADPSGDTYLDWPLTGFLLRSAVVDGWRGLEVMAYKSLSEKERKTFDASGLTQEQQDKLEKDGVAPLKALRIEQLSKDVMLGIFNGIIAQLVIRQPQEGLHFGLSKPKEAGQSYTKTLRELGYKNPDRAGEILQDKPIDLSSGNLMRDKTRGVINIKELAAEMKKELSGSGQLKPDTQKPNNFTSAEFAVEMIEAAGEFTYLPTIKTSKTS